MGNGASTSRLQLPSKERLEQVKLALEVLLLLALVPLALVMMVRDPRNAIQVARKV
jgi:hypothetical protein